MHLVPSLFRSLLSIYIYIIQLQLSDLTLNYDNTRIIILFQRLISLQLIIKQIN
jgi:hypothetical protein